MRARHGLQAVVHIEQHVARKLAHIVEVLLGLRSARSGTHVHDGHGDGRADEQHHTCRRAEDAEAVARDESARDMCPRSRGAPRTGAPFSQRSISASSASTEAYRWPGSSSVARVQMERRSAGTPSTRVSSSPSRKPSE